MRDKPSVQISPGACVFLAVALLLLPLPWVASVVTAALFHELCHLVAIRCCGGRVRMVRIGGGGAAIQIGDLPREKELICALAGPLGGLCLLLLARWTPRLALCGMVHSLYNLVPIYPLDGGRALACAASIILPPKQALRLCAVVRNVCILALLGLCVWLSAGQKLGNAPLIAGVVMLIRQDVIKFPCKPRRLRVQ